MAKKLEGLKMKYFVLKPAGNSVYAIASQEAMRAFASSIRAHNPELCDDLYEWADAEAEEAS